MKLYTALNIALISLLGVFAQSASATIVWDEQLSGDFNEFDTHSPFLASGTDIGLLAAGDHQVLGQFGTNALNQRDSDVITFTIASGHQLTAINLLYNVVAGNNGSGSYFNIATGNQVGTAFTTASTNLSDALLGIDSELIAAFAAGPYAAGSGLAGPLTADTYSLGMHETGAIVDYELEFVVRPIPLPASLWLFSAALAVLFGKSRVLSARKLLARR